jgi:NADH-quinone oxidoreductase subunit L
MVTAGVYMVARSHLVFNRAPDAQMAVAIIGTLTAIFAASIGIVQTDIKKVLAYSTISQLGYMFMACGVLDYVGGIFHLVTHAFFKALLFLAAGSVIHGLGGEQDMRNMGGLRKHLPYTFWCMTIATFAIAGLPPFAGFFSKDRILWSAWSNGYRTLWLIGVITAGMTSFYMFRLWFLTFFGDYRGPNPETAGHGHDAHAGGHGHGQPHESPMVMVVPLMILALLSFIGGWVGVPHSLHGSDHFDSFLSPVFHATAAVAPAGTTTAAPAEEAAGQGESSTELVFTGISVSIALLGFLSAWWLYYKRPELPGKMAKAAGGLYTFVLDKYKVDELYGAVFIQPLIALSLNVFWKGIDRGLIDGAVDGSAAGAREVSDEMRHMQSGNIRSYAGWVAVGAAAVIAFMVWRGVR